MQYELSSEVEKVASKVIRQHHPDLAHKKIYYLLLDKKDADGMSVAKWSKGHQIAAEIKVISGDAAFLLSRESRSDDLGPESVVVVKVYSLPWRNIDKEQTREALLDSQLCRLVYDDETGKPSIMEYDAKVYGSNLKRYGAWNHEIERLFEATKELPLLEGLDKAAAPKVVKANGNGKEAEAPPAPAALPPITEAVAKKRGRAARAGR